MVAFRFLYLGLLIGTAFALPIYPRSEFDGVDKPSGDGSWTSVPTINIEPPKTPPEGSGRESETNPVSLAYQHKGGTSLSSAAAAVAAPSHEPLVFHKGGKPVTKSLVHQSGISLTRPLVPGTSSTKQVKFHDTKIQLNPKSKSLEPVTSTISVSHQGGPGG